MDLEGSARGINGTLSWHLPEVVEETYGKYMWIRDIIVTWSYNASPLYVFVA
jgi:hypothetical protein